MITAHDRIGDWAEAGLLEPVSYWIKSNELNAYLTPALQALTYRHQLYGLPLSCKALALFYNPQLTPDPPQTLTELIEIARALKARHADETARGEDAPRVWGLAVPEIDSLYFHAPWLHAYGGRATRLGRPELDSVAMRRSVHVVHDLRAQGLIPPEIDGALSSTLFKNGELAFLINGPWLVAELGDLPPERWSVAPLPRIKDAEAPLTPYLSVEGVMISSRARDPQLAWRLARYLASTERALARLKRGELVAHSQLDATGALKLPAWQSAFQEQLAMTIPMSNDPLMKALWRPMKLALELTLIRGDDPAMTLKSAQSSALKILEDL
jgi:maltose-binding protein MalE